VYDLCTLVMSVELRQLRCLGITPESTVTQYPRPGVVYRPLRDAPPVPVRVVWWRDDAHPATSAAVGLLTSLFRHPSR